MPTPRPAGDSGARVGLRLAGAVSAAADVRLLVLAAVGLGLTWGFGALLGAPAPIGLKMNVGVSPFERDVRPAILAARMLAPARVVIEPWVRALGIGAGNAAFARALATGLWAWVVWSLIGGAMARIAVVRAAGAFEGVSLLEALRFVVRRVGALLPPPLAPILAFLVCSLPGMLIGWLYWSHEGTEIAGWLLVGPLLAAVPMSLLAIGLALAWPFMVATVAAEDEDAFDAVSRSFSYVSRRPGHMAVGLLAAGLLGVIGLAAIDILVEIVIRLAGWSLALSGPDDRIAAEVLADPRRLGEATAGHAVWLGLARCLPAAWAFAYAWSAVARLYLWLRWEVDGTPWHDVAETPGPQRLESRPDSE